MLKEEREHWEHNKKNILVLRAFKGPRRLARMRKPSEMYVASRIQDMVQIRAWNACFATKLHV